LFGGLLLVFHPTQWICFYVFGYQAHKKSVDYLNFCLLRTTHVLGTSFEVSGRDNIPKDAPIIFVANHQSLYDIVAMIWFFRRAHPKFVSKKELGRHIPSVSFNLRHGGSVLIDRKDPKQALPVIKKLAEYIEQNKRSAVIFPEGTRSKTGHPKPFQQSGLKMLCKYAPSAYVVPVTINQSYKMVRYGLFPMGLGSRLQFMVHEAIPVAGNSIEEILQKTESKVVESIKI
jgi:1-acyl-sn-glycerol-3-phosphate acyltransferase